MVRVVFWFVGRHERVGTGVCAGACVCNAATDAWRLWQVIQLDTDVGTDISVAGNIDRAVDTPNLATIGATFNDLLDARYI